MNSEYEINPVWSVSILANSSVIDFGSMPLCLHAHTKLFQRQCAAAVCV